MNKAVRVLIVDDSAVIRRVLEKELSKHPLINVVGSAPDPYVARDLIVARKPDVISLDIEMPRMDGITFLRKLMHHYPIPVVIVSSLTRKGGEISMEALNAGAVVVVEKSRAAYSAAGLSGNLAETLISAATVDVRRIIATGISKPLPVQALKESTNKVLAIGASTGGTAAVETLLMGLPVNLPGTLVSQHMPEGFTEAFARRLSNETGLDVREAKNGDSVVPGRVLIAPGNRHLLLGRSGARYIALVKDGPRVNMFRPSVDVLMKSVAEKASGNSIGVLLTGMGKDGAEGLLEMKKHGAPTVVQDEASCVVFGMPKAAIDLKAVDSVVSINKMAAHLTMLFERK